MSDEEVAAAVLRRWVHEEGAYWCVGDRRDGDGFLTLDGTVEITAAETAALLRVMEQTDGQGWWRRIEGAPEPPTA